MRRSFHPAGEALNPEAAHPGQPMAGCACHPLACQCALMASLSSASAPNLQLVSPVLHVPEFLRFPLCSFGFSYPSMYLVSGASFGDWNTATQCLAPRLSRDILLEVSATHTCKTSIMLMKLRSHTSVSRRQTPLDNSCCGL